VQALTRAGVKIRGFNAAHLGELSERQTNGFAAVAICGEGHNDAEPRFEIRRHAQLRTLDLNIRITFTLCHLKT